MPLMSNGMGVSRSMMRDLAVAGAGGALAVYVMPQALNMVGMGYGIQPSMGALVGVGASIYAANYLVSMGAAQGLL